MLSIKYKIQTFLTMIKKLKILEIHDFLQIKEMMILIQKITKKLEK